LTYQIPFCEVLTARGYDILHVSRHGRGEHGKDIVARSRRGRLFSFQLKGGDIALSDWRSIRGEVEELVQLPVRLPGVGEDEPHTPVLVTNGEIRGDAIDSIVRYRDTWERAGYPLLRVISRRTLLRQFLDAQGQFLPTGLVEFRRFVELFVADFTDRLPRERFAKLLEDLLKGLPTKSALHTTRSLAGIAVVAGYIAEQYERAENHVAAAEAWTIAGCVILHVAERDGLAARVYEPVLRLLGLALDRSLEAFATDLLSREHLMEGSLGIADPFVYGARVSLSFGWLAATAHRRDLLGATALPAKAVHRLLLREWTGIRFAGEVDWPAMMLVALYADRHQNSYDAEAILELWVRMILGANAPGGNGLPSPYWLHERVIELANEMLAPNEEEAFSGRSYSLASALDMLVRRLRRQLVGRRWPAASRLDWCDFCPEKTADYFLWQAEEGVLVTGRPVPEASWSEWRDRAASVATSEIPAVMGRHPEWLPPFLMTYPHRANRCLSAFADSVIGKRAVFR
jgi:hypothetical protein